MSEKILAAAVGLVLTGGLVAGCAASTSDVTTSPSPDVTISATATPSSTPSAAATTPAAQPTTTAPTRPATAVPAVGAPVAASDVAAVRKAGGDVYVSPNGDGSGVVVKKGAPLPEAMVNDTKAGTVAKVPSTAKEWAATDMVLETKVIPAIQASGVYVVVIMKVGSWDSGGRLQATQWSVGVYGPNQASIQQLKDALNSHSAAQAKAREQAAKYGAQIIDAG